MTTKEEVIELDRNNNITRNFNNSIKKDTVRIPNGGYVVIRFKAENPGKVITAL